MRKKKKRTELESAEDKYQSLLDKRNELNKLARALREERDLVNERKKSMANYVRELKAKRDELVKVRREHINLRNRYQSQAKSLIGDKRSRRKKIYPSLPREVEALKADIQMMEKKQQTTPLSLDDEKELIDEIKRKKDELEELEGRLSEQSDLNKEVKEIDGSIDDLFERGDEEHAKVVDLSGKIDELHEKMSELVNELSVMDKESDKKHNQALKLRERADTYHKKAQDMRQKVLRIRKEKDTDKREARKLVRQQQEEVEEFFGDEEKRKDLDKDAIEELKKGKKLQL